MTDIINAPPAPELIRLLNTIQNHDKWSVSFLSTGTKTLDVDELDLYRFLIYYGDGANMDGTLIIEPRIDHGTESILGYIVKWDTEITEDESNRLYVDEDAWFPLADIDPEFDSCWTDAVLPFEEAIELGHHLVENPSKLLDNATKYEYAPNSQVPPA